MFQKLHIHMTVFSTLITGAILTIMALACLFITEKSIRQNHYTTFTNNAYSCVSYLEGQNLLSHRWMQQVQDNYGIIMKVQDNGTPLYFDKLHENAEANAAIELAMEESAQNQGLDLSSSSFSQALSKVAVFSIPGYYACTARIPKEAGTLDAVFLYSLTGQQKQLVTMRLTFLAAVAAALLALAVFSWFFTKKMIRPLEESRRQQTQFIASASHELRSPLAVILSSSQAMKSASLEEKARFTETIQSECTRMSRLIGDMLSLANADNHSWSIKKAPCELDTLLLDTYEKYEPQMKEHHLRLSVELPDEPLAPCLCDASRISQVLGILLDNALSYVPSGGQIRLCVSLTEGGFCLLVSDNGPGIPDAAKKSIFQRFYRADTARKDKQHFGLGLCIAQEILTLHNGTIKVRDSREGGAEFVLFLPWL